MNTTKRKLVIITPVKDEEWILERFLVAASEVADHILVLDQQSQDRSREICSRFSKVVVLENTSREYNEAERSRQMFDGVRKLWGEGNVLVALDADEIIAGVSLTAASWQAMRELESGTAIYLEKPELLPGPARCVRQTPLEWFLLGVVDDGAEHQGLLIHSQRVPARRGAPRYYADDIKVMHFCRLRPIEFAVRQAFYCMVENARATKSHRVRSIYYSPRFFSQFGAGVTEPCPGMWFQWYEDRRVSLWSYHSQRFNSFHRRALELIAKHGERQFWFDDIWWENWEGARQHFLSQGATGLPDCPIVGPTRSHRWLTARLLSGYAGLRSLARLLRKRSRYYDCVRF